MTSNWLIIYVVYHLDYFAKAGFCMPASDIHVKSHEVLILEFVNCDGTLPASASTRLWNAVYNFDILGLLYVPNMLLDSSN
jgi:hypothetical protein